MAVTGVVYEIAKLNAFTSADVTVYIEAIFYAVGRLRKEIQKISQSGCPGSYKEPLNSITRRLYVCILSSFLS